MQNLHFMFPVKVVRNAFNITFNFLDGHPMMVTGSTIGHIALWDLESKKLKSQIRDAHEGAVVGMQCLPNEPLMVTNAADNSLKVIKNCETITFMIISANI